MHTYAGVVGRTGPVTIGWGLDMPACNAMQTYSDMFVCKFAHMHALSSCLVLTCLPGLHASSQVPADFRQRLSEAGVRTGRSLLQHSVAGPDGTTKYLLQLADGRVVRQALPLNLCGAVCHSMQNTCGM